MKSKVVLVMPVLVIPFISLAFYALGGGSGVKAADNDAKDGLNLKVPDATLKNEVIDKLGFYTRADKDSTKIKEWMKNDPYYSSGDLSFDAVRDPAAKPVLPNANRATAPEDELLTKIARLQQSLQTNSSFTQQDDVRLRAPVPVPADVARLETMMQNFPKHEEDPSMRQISEVMDKILDVQHPERMQEKVRSASLFHETFYLPVSLRPGDDTTVHGFYGVDYTDSTHAANAIEAVVHDGQVLVNGSVIKFRLLQDVFIGSNKIPSGTFVFALVTINGERLTASIESIRSGSNIYPVKMEVFDMDGLPGLYIPGAITRDVVKQSANNPLQSMDMNTIDPSFKMQAAAAGINTARSLLTKKVKVVKVTVKAGYRVFLKQM